MESQPQNPEFRMNPENFHPCSSQFSRQHSYFKQDFQDGILMQHNSKIQSPHQELNPRPLAYKASGLSMTIQRVLVFG